MRAHVLYWLRQIHLYLGIFTTPALLFFAFSGALQTLNLNDRSPEGAYTPPHWIAVLAQIHKKQVAQLPPHKPSLPESAGSSKSRKTEVIAAAQPTVPPGADQTSRTSVSPPKPVALKAFFVLVCVSLFASTLSGAWMAWKFRRNRIALVMVFLAGAIVPLLMTKF